MTVIAMSRTEIDRMSVLEDLAASRIKMTEAASLMGLGRRQVYRLARAYLLRGPAALVSRRRGKPSNRSYASDVRATATCRSSFLAVLSQPEHLAAQVEIVAQVFGRPLVDHPAALQRYRGIRQR